MKLDSLKKLYCRELGDLYDAENQLAKALPKMAEAASSPDLRRSFQKHLDQKRDQLKRLDKAFFSIEEKPGRVACRGMKGLIEEGEEMIKVDADPAVKDAGLIAAAQRVEHYQMAGYGCARTYAEMLGEKDSAKLLQKTLDEARTEDQGLTDLAKRVINSQVARF